MLFKGKLGYVLRWEILIRGDFAKKSAFGGNLTLRKPSNPRGIFGGLDRGMRFESSLVENLVLWPRLISARKELCWLQDTNSIFLIQLFCVGDLGFART